MAAKPARKGEPEFEGGAQPVPERPHDQPGRARGPTFLLLALLAFMALAMPVAWAVGALVTIGEAAGTGALVALWVVWAIIVLIFIWAVIALWRRAA